jgi:O-antigen/teichoic acid export membrane protein
MLFRLSKNAFSLTVMGFVDKLAGVLFFAIIARKLTQVEFGMYSLVVALLLFGGLLANFGLEYVIIRDVAKNRERARALLNNCLLITLFFSGIAWPLIVGLAFLLNYPPEVITLVSFGGVMLVFMGLGQTASAVLKAFERMEIFALIGSLKSVLGLVLGALTLWLGGGVAALVVVLMITECLKAGALTWIVHRYFASLGREYDKQTLLRIVKQAIPFALLMVYGILIRRVDLLLMGWLRPLDEVAVYGVATKIADALSLLSTSMVGALFPTFSAKLTSSRDEVWKLYNESIGVFAILGFGVALAVLALAEPILLLISGPQYLIGALALRWLGWAFLFNVLSGPVGIVLLAADDQMKQLIAMCAVVISSNIVLNVWLIPLYSYNGAATAMCVSAFLGFAGRLILARAYFGQWPHLLSTVWRPFVAGLGMAGALGLLHHELNIYATVIAGGLTYSLLLVVLGELRQARYEPIWRRLAILRSGLPRIKLGQLAWPRR